jgi:NADH:ubiquinone oxidoreductase subunit F (NADH-binding)
MSSVSASATLPRVLAGMRSGGPMGLEHHLEVHGPLPAFAHRRRESGALLHELERSGLRGRGGAEFPTATKMRAVIAARGRATVVANGCEGEPASLKDRLLIERLPHLVLDGALLAAQAIDAAQVFIAVDADASHALRAINRALRERSDMSRGRSSASLVAVPRGYVSGQETAVINFLGGGPAKPTATPPPIFQRGVNGRPTLVNNVETLAHIALIARHGGDWFCELGSEIDPGSRLVTLGGAVVHPGVFEIEAGAPLTSLLTAAGGRTSQLRAFLLGGYAGTWVTAVMGSELALGSEELDARGASLGAGVIIALPTSACPVAEVASVARWLSAQSARQCGPCFNGLEAIASSLEQVRVGRDPRALGRISRWASLANGRGACAHPDGTVRFVTSAIEVFSPEFDDHSRHGPCAACLERHLLPTPIPLRSRVAA